MENDLMTIRYSSIVGGGGSQGFNLDIGTSGNTTFVFSESQPAGGYSISSQLADVSLDFYAIAQDGTLAGFTDTKSLIATKDFNKMVVYGATNNDLLSFEFKPTALPTANGDQNSGVAPFLTSATPATLESIDDTTTVTGGNFATDVAITFTGTDSVVRNAKSIVRTSSKELIVTRPDVFPPAAEPFSMIATNPGITNPSTNVNRLTNYFDAGGDISWVTSAGALPTATLGSPYSTLLQATDPDNTTITYSIVSGSLPNGLSLNPETGLISGTGTTSETQSFSVRATDAGGNFADRSFSITVAIIVQYLVVAGGGGGGTLLAGGGAGGYREGSAFGASVGQNYTVTVGAGGTGAGSSNNLRGGTGNNSVFATISASGGGGGAGEGPQQFQPVAGMNGSPGGSGGGASQYAGVGGAGNIGGYTPVEGYAGGGVNGYLQAYASGGGGGAAAAGGDGTGASGGNGGIGAIPTIISAALASSFSIGQQSGGNVYFAGGGAGIKGNQGTDGAGGLGGGAGKHAAGAARTGGGGGGKRVDEAPNANVSGGSGVVVLCYPSNRTINVGAGLTASTLTDGGTKVTAFTAGTGTISFS
jgi:hypothetical protein